MKKLWRIARTAVHLPFLDTIEDTVRSLGEGGRVIFLALSALLIVSSVGLVYTLKSAIVIEVPTRGGSFSEGILGSPRFINPILAISDADRDLTSLVYSGLLRATPSGGYTPDLAQSYEISEDGKTYTFVLRPQLTFHDGTPLTADDVVYTVQKAQDAALKSPLRANWDGVLVEALDASTVQFTLKSAYAPFIENLTLGILPKARWGSINDEEFPFSDLNAEPIGSGPYAVSNISRTSSGIPSVYTLRSFNSYALGEPYLQSVTLRFYQSEGSLTTALSRGEIEAASGISPDNLSSIPKDRILTSPLNRVFGVFFNQNQSSILRDKAVRVALNDSVNREELVSEVLGGYGTPLRGPVPPTIARPEATPSATSSAAMAEASRNYLLARGWTAREDGILVKITGKGATAQTAVLKFDLATANVPELRAAAEYLRAQWTRVGAEVDVKIFEQGDLSQNIIRPRKYDALLFGEVIGRELDLFAFWHSSQRIDPGLNIALYANAAADKALESLRATTETDKRAALLQTFTAEVEKDLPAVFLYTPDFVYSIPNDIAGVDLGFIETPDDRFLSLPYWHKETDQIWPLFKRFAK
jgi:peptide/nickel transport system substrate-binding protein